MVSFVSFNLTENPDVTAASRLLHPAGLHQAVVPDPDGGSYVGTSRA